MAGGFCAAGLAVMDDPAARRRGLLWFAGGHAVVFLAVVSQRVAIWGPGIGDRVAQSLLFVTLVLLYLWAFANGEPVRRVLIGIFDEAPANSAANLRSQYEQQIRQAGAHEERNRLARDLHDSIKQQIFVIQTAAATAQTRFDADSEGAMQALEQVRGSAREAMTEMEAMLDQLRAAPLGNAGLVESLKRQCEALGFRTGANVEFKPGDLPPVGALAAGVYEAVFRVAQEALANVGRHARATQVLVSLGSARRRLVLRIEDNGAGFDPNQSRPGMGLANMHERAKEYGEFELMSRPGGGTTVKFSIPYVGEAPGEYRRRFRQWGLACAVAVSFLTWRKDWSAAFFAAISVIGFVRYAVAYRIARKELAE